ncbi:MAG: ATP-binding protein [Treponemataceae bacterium]
MTEVVAIKDFIRIEETFIKCEKHGDINVEIPIFFGKPVVKEFIKCPLCVEEKENELKEKEDKERRIRAIKNTNISKEYWLKKIDDYEIFDETQEKALLAIKKIISEKKGKAVLVGNNGVGKTHLGSMAVKYMGGKIYTMFQISAMLRGSFSSNAEKSEIEIIEYLSTIPLLVIDEIGKTKGSEAELNWISVILNERHANYKPFILLSEKHFKSNCLKNGCVNCFENYINKDVISRLQQDSFLITIRGFDYRGKK